MRQLLTRSATHRYPGELVEGPSGTVLPLVLYLQRHCVYFIYSYYFTFTSENLKTARFKNRTFESWIVGYVPLRPNCRSPLFQI